MLRAYAQLLRLPNVFTAWADVALGAFIASRLCADSEPGLEWAPVLVAFLVSTSLYWAGMVLNDYFDAEEDARDRPFRPIPSGRVSRRAAGWLGAVLLTLGVFVTAARCLVQWDSMALQVALLLVFLIILYNAWAKRTQLGPFVMGGCRFLHVLLAVAFMGGTPGINVYEQTTSYWSVDVNEQHIQLWVLGIAAAVGAYITVVSFIAKNEAHFPRVQRAVKFLLMGLIGLDALLAFCVVGWAGLLILLLLPPALILGKWVYST